MVLCVGCVQGGEEIMPLRVPPGAPGFPDDRGPTPQPVGVWGWLRLLYKIAREWRKERKRKRKGRR